MRPTYPVLKLFTILFPPLLVGTAEVVRHEWWAGSLSMEAGNVIITVIVFVMSWWYAVWMFRRIEASNNRLAEEEARRAVYEERERLADELHDHIAQGLFFLNVKLQKGRTDEAKSAVADIHNHLRQAIFNLRTDPLEQGDYAGRLGRWLEEWSALSGIPCRTDIRCTGPGLPTADEVRLSGLIQEAFINIRKHSRAERASFLFEESTEGWKAVISDDGIGMDADTWARGLLGGEGHYGLSMMARRAEELGADMRLTGAGPDGGTQITVTFNRKEPGI
ncbi:sensor histidine kinase [Gorillibacterium sp. sgz5001074]|uniref:sensor histidine kinase n=1 Tax=Gorillibacterium sp. sgz5001074 TaxID=3446695 RepID=UPI003F67C578